MSWQNIFILMADYKLSSSFSKNRKNNSKKTPQFILFILTHFHQKINYFIPLKKSCCPHILLFLFSPFLLHPSLFTKCRKAPFYKALIEKIKHKKGEKRRGGLNCTPCQGHFYLFVLGNICSLSLILTIPSNG